MFSIIGIITTVFIFIGFVMCVINKPDNGYFYGIDKKDYYDRW